MFGDLLGGRDEQLNGHESVKQGITDLSKSLTSVVGEHENSIQEARLVSPILDYFTNAQLQTIQ
jgi:hypothetical protein